MERAKVGLIGCGQISSIYLEAPRKFDILDIVACADIDLERARAQAERYGIPHACSVEELLAMPEIEIGVNLTIPRVHAEVSSAILQAGKAVYSEKPLGVRRAQGQALLELAAEKQLRVGCAPDTFLGGGIQTCVQLINEGKIGVPVAATAFMMMHGHESWHPDPAFYYQVGGGPLFDMGPYYLTALIAMLGPVRRVTSSASMTFAERTITSQPKYGTKIPVETPTHIAGVLDFANGAVCTLIMSFDVWSSNLPHIEIYGTEGSLNVPDPNGFGGQVSLRGAAQASWQSVPLTHGYTDNSRGLGVADMAYASRAGRPHRASGALAYHVLEIMEALLTASRENRHREISSSCERPAPLKPGTHDWLAENSL